MSTILIIWTLVGVLIYEAIERIIHIEDVKIDGLIMLITSLVGILFNVINLLILRYCCNGPKEETKKDEKEEKEEKENVNVRAAIIHLLGDLIQAVGVFVAAMIIYFRPEWKIADPITTFVFAVLVAMTTVPIFFDSMRILMEYAPEDLDMAKLHEKINELAEVVDLHVWIISEEKTCLTLTIRSKDLEKQDRTIVQNVKKMLEDDFGIEHSTIEMAYAETSSKVEIESP